MHSFHTNRSSSKTTTWSSSATHRTAKSSTSSWEVTFSSPWGRPSTTTNSTGSSSTSWPEAGRDRGGRDFRRPIEARFKFAVLSLEWPASDQRGCILRGPLVLTSYPYDSLERHLSNRTTKIASEIPPCLTKPWASLVSSRLLSLLLLSLC